MFLLFSYINVFVSFIVIIIDLNSSKYFNIKTVEDVFKDIDIPKMSLTLIKSSNNKSVSSRSWKKTKKCFNSCNSQDMEVKFSTQSDA